MGNWKPEMIKASDLARKISYESDGEITVPKFQRNLVWSNNQKETFIDSIKKGYPFGSILIYKEADGKLQLIDGLQRCNTIKEFVNNPSKFFNASDVDAHAIKQIFDLLRINANRSTVETKITDILIFWINQHKTLSDIVSIQYRDFSDELAQHFATAPGVSREIAEAIKPMLQKFIEIAKTLNDASIPALVFEGDKSILPEVFERINSKGTHLSKYQIYAAAWSVSKINITDTDFDAIPKHVYERYDAMIQNDFIIEDLDYNKMTKDKNLDLFHFLFGFGKIIRGKFPYLFGTEKGKESVVSEAFTLANACLGQKYTDLKSLNSNLREILKTDKKINLFFKKILETIKYTDEHLLRSIHKFKGNKRMDTSISPLHTELQIVSIISSAFLLQYGEYNKEIDIKGNEHIDIILNLDKKTSDWKDKQKVLKKNLFKIYAMDIIQQRWKGSGDKKLNDYVYNPTKYAREVNWDEFKSVLENWFNYTKFDRNERQKVRNPKEEEKAVLNLLYINKLSAYEQLSNENFDFEHLATKEIMKSKLEAYGEQSSLPISSIGNLCILPEYVNRSKKGKLLFNDDSYINKLEKKGIRKSDLENKFSLAKKDDFEWLGKTIQDFETFRDEYFKFIQTRFDRILESIKEDHFNNGR